MLINLSPSAVQQMAIKRFVSNFDDPDQMVVQTMLFLDQFDSDSVKNVGFNALCHELSKKKPSLLLGFLSDESDMGEEKRRVASENYAQYLSSLNMIDLVAEAKKVPHSYSDQVIKEALHKKGGRISRDAGRTIQDLDHLMKIEEWELVDTIGLDWVKKGTARGQDSHAWAKWAITLSPNDNNNALFRMAVSGYLDANPNTGKEWVEQFPDGWAKKQALTQLIVSAKSKEGFKKVAQWAESELQTQ